MWEYAASYRHSLQECKHLTSHPGRVTHLALLHLLQLLPKLRHSSAGLRGRLGIHAALADGPHNAFQALQPADSRHTIKT